ncbi:TPA: hypothetical protein ACFO03_000099 [Neisseria meningitidis]
MAHPDYAAFKAGHLAKFAAWHTQNDLAAIQPGRLIRKWSESLLDAFKPGSLIEEYDFYQILTDYWAETLQDDVYLIAQDGWKAVKNLAEITKESDEDANLTVVFEETETGKKGKAKTKRISKKYRSEVIAPELVARRYFSDGIAKLEEKQSELERLSQELENHIEEHGGEEGALNDVLDAKGKLSAKLLKTALEESGIRRRRTGCFTNHPNTDDAGKSRERRSQNPNRSPEPCRIQTIRPTFRSRNQAACRSRQMACRFTKPNRKSLGKQYSAAYQPLEHAGRPLPQPDGRACPRSGKVAKQSQCPP